MGQGAPGRDHPAPARATDPPAQGLRPPAVPGNATRRTRRRGLAVAAALVGVTSTAGGALLAWSGPPTSQDRLNAAVPATSPARDDPLDGTRFRVTAEVVHVPGRATRICTPLPQASAARPAGPPGWCYSGVDVVGVDLTALSDRREEAGATEGHAKLTGTWRAGVLHVEQQRPPAPLPVSPREPDRPPCPTPTGGWSTGEVDTAPVEAYMQAHPGQVDVFAFLRPSPGQVLLHVLTSADPSTVRAALATDYRLEQLCVAKSAHSPDQLAAAQADPALNAGDLPTTGVSSLGRRITADGQQIITADVMMETPAITAALRRHPPGILEITSWIQRAQ